MAQRPAAPHVLDTHEIFEKLPIGRGIGNEAPPFIGTPDHHAAECEEARWHPERETLLLAAAGAAKVLGPMREQ